MRKYYIVPAFLFLLPIFHVPFLPPCARESPAALQALSHRVCFCGNCQLPQAITTPQKRRAHLKIRLWILQLPKLWQDVKAVRNFCHRINDGLECRELACWGGPPSDPCFIQWWSASEVRKETSASLESNQSLIFWRLRMNGGMYIECTIALCFVLQESCYFCHVITK